MLGISALNFDIKQKLDIFSISDKIEFIEYGVDVPEDFKVLQKHLEKCNNIPKIAFHLPLKLNSFEDIMPLRQSNLNYVKSIIKEGLEFKPLYFNMHLGYEFSSKYPGNANILNDLCISYIEELLEIDESINIYIENVYTSNKTGGCDLFAVGVNQNQLIHIVKNLASKRTGFCYDTGHHMIQNEPFDDASLFKNCILHFNVNDQKRDLHLGLKSGTKFDSVYFDRLIKSHEYKHAVLELSSDELLNTLHELEKSDFFNSINNGRSKQ